MARGRADGLAHERHRARGARIDLQHIDRLAFDGVLDVHEADHFQFASHGVRVLADGLDDVGGQGVRRQDHRGVARMDAGKLDVLEDAADDDGAIGWILEAADIGDAIHIHLGGVLEELVHQHRPFGGGLDGEAHVMPQLGVGIDDLHGASAEDEAGADEDGVAEGFGHGDGLGLAGGDAVGRLGDVELAEHRREELAVFGDLDALGRGADDVDAVLLQAQGEVQGGLAAELGDGAPAFFTLVNVQHVLEGRGARSKAGRWCRSRSRRSRGWS